MNIVVSRCIEHSTVDQLAGRILIEMLVGEEQSIDVASDATGAILILAILV